MFPYFQVFGKTIGSYALCATVGLILCGVVASVLAKRYRMAYEDIVLLMVVIGVSLLIGGHILFGITNLSKVIPLLKEASSYSLKEIFSYLAQYFGGMVYYGGFIGACAGLFLYTKFSKTVEREIAFDLYAVSIPLFHVFGRIGCFLSGCCYGIESNFGFVVHGNPLVPELNDVRRLPVPLIEAVCNLVIFFVLLRMFLKEKEKGKMIWYYMLIYPVVRFVLEFFRGDAIRGILFGLSTSQWISIFLFAIAIWKLFLSKGKGRAVCAGVLFAVVLLTGMPLYTAHATQEAVTQSVEEKSEQMTEQSPEEELEQMTEQSSEEEPEQMTEQSSAEVSEQETGVADTKEPPFTTQQKFIIFVCCFFSVGICIVIGLYGNPNDRLKDKYRRARKQQMLQEKKKREKEAREARRAAEEAKYEAELAEYEAAQKAYEEAKAAKTAAKEAKKAEKANRKSM